jgi:signal transduction histidine kinase
MNSLEWRLHLGLGATLGLLLLGLGWLGDRAMLRMGEKLVIARLQHDAESLLAALREDQAGRLSLLAQRLSPVYHQPFSGHYYAIYPPDEPPLRSRSLWDSDLSNLPLAPGEEMNFPTGGPAGQRLLAWAGGFHKAGRDLRIVVAEDVTSLRQNLAELRAYYAGLGVAALFLLLAVQSLVIRRSLRGLQQARDDVRRLERGEIDRLTEAVPGEILPLVRELNRLLGLLNERIQRSRNALGNLAHALKTPLTLLQRLSREGNLPADTAAQLQNHTDALRRRIDHELKRARLAGNPLPGRRFAPAAELPDLAEVLRRIYPDKTLICQADTTAEFPGDREDYLELFGNLLDNACKWARTTVRCEVGPDLDARIADDGPGIPTEELEALTRRGTRLDENTPGHGLGLAIARDIVALYGGQLSFGKAGDLGGLEVRIRLGRLAESTKAFSRRGSG